MLRRRNLASAGRGPVLRDSTVDQAAADALDQAQRDASDDRFPLRKRDVDLGRDLATRP
jgi:hypothetical protein